jgi:UDP-2-acetamido-2,6-beta-L-arabino-hexul-4-ose reductase
MRFILITGSSGFIGHALCMELERREGVTLLRHDIENSSEDLHAALARADVIFHLAGVNRPQDPKEFETGNAGLTGEICSRLIETGHSPLLILSSSTQAELDNPYGISKRRAEEEVREYAAQTKAEVAAYRFPNVFGRGCRPNYNSAVATFCHNIARDLEIKVNDPSVEMTLVYIDDVVEELMRALDKKPTRQGAFCRVPVEHVVRLGRIVELLEEFKQSRIDIHVPDQADAFSKKLYATYLSYLPTDRFSYPLTMYVDDRGSFTPFLKTTERGQVSVNISKPHITKGNHWHHTKNEKFLVVSGRGVIRLRMAGGQRTDDGGQWTGIDEEMRPSNIEPNGEIIEYFVSGEKLEVVDIPPGYTHNIENLGETDMVTVMWVNEVFDPERPDTIFEEV